jgi:fructose-bisphosphate aldolase class 1
VLRGARRSKTFFHFRASHLSRSENLFDERSSSFEAVKAVPVLSGGISEKEGTKALMAFDGFTTVPHSDSLARFS